MSSQLQGFLYMMCVEQAFLYFSSKYDVMTWSEDFNAVARQRQDE